ncbi:hypothetical protein ACHAXA_006968 [Cyclostephanos tholiformis]|uniref:Uncharacterized protein n=1 Tax=Cyclostephanos tholiformis TaxID=382380 RepID=A0ABD3RXH8_9STRA
MAIIVVVAIWSDTKGGGELAISYIHEALGVGVNVVSANKCPLMMQHHHCGTTGGGEVYCELKRLALTNNVTNQHESSVLDGVPVFSLWKYALPHA